MLFSRTKINVFPDKVHFFSSSDLSVSTHFLYLYRFSCFYSNIGLSLLIKKKLSADVVTE